MKKFTLYCGLNDRTTKRQEIATLEAAKIVQNACLRYTDGATIFEADGIYKHEDGSFVVEKTLRVELLFATAESVRKIADAIKTALNQEAIAVQEQDIASEMW